MTNTWSFNEVIKPVINPRKRDPSNCEDWTYRRGDIYLADLNPFTGSEQGGTRPVLVLQNNDGNIYCPTLIIAPMTTKLKKQELPTHCCFEMEVYTYLVLVACVGDSVDNKALKRIDRLFYETL